MKIPAIKKSFVIHPLLFPMFFVLALYAYNKAELSFSVTLLPLALALGFALLLLALSWLILRNVRKAGIIVSIFLILFFSYGHALDLLMGWGAGDFYIRGLGVTPRGYVLLIWAALFAAGAYLTIRTHRDFLNLTIILNVVAVVMVLVPSISIAAYELKRPTFSPDYNPPIGTIDSGDIDTLPDIYYIILDGYASSSTLEEIYNHDNHEFTDYLTEKGFYVADESTSNYSQTFLSIASSLNMEYINYLSDVIGSESRDRRVPLQMITDSRVVSFLKSNGYQFINFQSGIESTNYNEHADLNVQCGRMDEFSTVLIQSTMLRLFDKYLVEEDARERLLCTFSRLAEVHLIEEPTFVFAHINCPHPPYLFGADGEKVKPIWPLNPWKPKEMYVNQLIFLNTLVKALVDEILTKSEIPPIIILQADHGTAAECGDIDLRTLTVESIHQAHACNRERMRIFNAYYLPGGGSDLLYERISPVNTFRVIFNFYFDASYELLSDYSYRSVESKPYQFIDVTEEVGYD